MRALLRAVLPVLLLAVVLSPKGAAQEELSLGVPQGAEPASVNGYVDGDKFKVLRANHDEEEVLLAGIDAPEKGECYYKESSARVKKLLPKYSTIYLERSGDDRDGKDRLIRYVWLPGKNGKKATLLNTKLVREGYAGFDNSKDNPKYFTRIKQVEQAAKVKKAGLWKVCGKLHAPPPPPMPTPKPAISGMPNNVEPATVTEIVDGDTIKVQLTDGSVETVRLILIDTPETKDPNSPVECYGAEASAYTASVLPVGSTVYLERDVSDRDQYDRLLRYVWYQDPTSGQAVLYNEQAVRAGYAVLATFPPDVKYVDRIRAAQDAAVAEGAGLWSACGGADTPLEPTAPPAENPPASGPGAGCQPSYPDFCIPIGPDLDCPDIGVHNFTVLPPDPYRFDADHDGVGCEG